MSTTRAVVLLAFGACVVTTSACGACGKSEVTLEDASAASTRPPGAGLKPRARVIDPSAADGAPLLADPHVPGVAPGARASGCSPQSPCARRAPCDAAPCPRQPEWKIEELALGGSFGCARYTNGRVWCTSTAPATELEITDVSRVVAGSGGHACVLAKGSVSCWGVGKSGQIGNGEWQTAPTPERVKGITSAVAIAAGGSHTCAIEKSGAVVCWGENTEGQLGDGTTDNRSEPVPVKGTTAARGLSLGLHHGCAIEKDGHVVCWGRKRGGPRGEAVTVP